MSIRGLGNDENSWLRLWRFLSPSVIRVLFICIPNIYSIVPYVYRGHPRSSQIWGFGTYSNLRNGSYHNHSYYALSILWG
jgi:hypothetical protein